MVDALQNSESQEVDELEATEDFTITEEALALLDEADIERINAELEQAYAEYDKKMRDIYSRQRNVVSKINSMIDQKKIDSIHSQLQNKNNTQ